MKKIIRILVLIIFASFVSVSCTEDFEALNTDPNGLTDEQSEADFINVGGPFKPIFLNIYRYDPAWHTQLQHNLNADTYCGYMSPPRPFVGGVNTTNYAFIDFWDQFAWDIPYSSQGTMQNALLIKKRGEADFPLMYALSLILKVEAMHRVTDVYGPIVYTQFGEDTPFPEYDSEQIVYDQFFIDLDNAINTLSADIDNQQFSAFDLVYGGGLTKWVQFANTLRLRLAMRISKVDPSKAQLEGEKSLSNSIGLIETNADNFIIKGGVTHPLTVFNSSWNDVRMGASMESVLVGYDDARGNVLFEDSSVVPNTIKGIRSGMPLLSAYNDELDQKADYVTFSRLGDSYISGSASATTDIQLMTAAEAHFLKAEAALRGWTGAGDAQSNYEQGISTSFEQHGVAGDAADYIADNTSTQLDYVDPVDATNNINALSDATIAWNGGDDNEIKLEKIITQKWIAMYPDGQEAWSEFRRTGYPQLFPPVANNSDGTIDSNIQVRRLPFPASQRSTNPLGVEQARTLLGGPDTGGTRLWWDTGESNF